MPTLLPIMKARATNASQPKTAVFQWLALQRPMRAAMLLERLRGDIAVQLLRVIDKSRVAPAGFARHPAHRRLAGVAVHTPEGRKPPGERRLSGGGRSGKGASASTVATAHERGGGR